MRTLGVNYVYYMTYIYIYMSLIYIYIYIQLYRSRRQVNGLVKLGLVCITMHFLRVNSDHLYHLFTE